MMRIVGRTGSGKSTALDAIWDNVTGIAGGAQRQHEGAAVYARDDGSISKWNGAQQAFDEPPRTQRDGRRRGGGKRPPTRWERLSEAIARTWGGTPANTKSSGMLLLIDEIEAGSTSRSSAGSSIKYGSYRPNSSAGRGSA